MTTNRLQGVVCAGALLCLLCATKAAHAYRPFDGTDADTARTGEFELELGPSQWYRLGTQNYLIAPATVLNFGVFADTELVIDFKDFLAVGPLTLGPRAALLDTDVLVKHVFRKGTLQDASGISIAAEGGVLTPEIHGLEGFGASLDVIVSYRWPWTTLHFNEQVQDSRAHNLDLFSSVIIEGPYEWKLRPVTEVFYEREYNVAETWSALVGAIWTVQESFVLDAAFRGARIADQDAFEVRLGFTWSIPFGKTENAARLRTSPTIARR